MVFSIAYRRPSHFRSSRENLRHEEKQNSIDESVKSCNSCMTSGIPPALSLDRIIAGGTCPPLTVRDFMNYLKYVEYSAENLQFFLWFRDYSARWEKLPESEKALAPAWSGAGQAEASIPATTSANKRLSSQMTAVLSDTDFAVQPSKTGVADPSTTPSNPDSFDTKRNRQSDHGSSSSGDKTLFSNVTHRSIAEQAFDDAGLLLPFTTQPFRDEISRIISIYLAEDAPRELNLSARERQAVLRALQHSTHPSAFQSIVQTVEYTLRQQAHPNFIRWTICNGNRPRVLFARGLGVALIVAAFTADLLITLSHAGRAWNVLPFIGWFLGIATLIAAWKGMCVVLHGLHHRHLRPWELFADEDETEEKLPSHHALTSDSRNSFESEPWVPRYEKRNVLRKILDREVWIKEPALRQIQDTIFLQSLLGSFVLSCIFVGIFCAVPRGNFY